MYTKIFLDLDGTVYLGNEIIDNVDAQIRRLSARGIEFYYMTNNTSLGIQDYVRKLAELNLPVSRESILSPTRVLTRFLLGANLSRIFVVGTASFVEELCTLSGAHIDQTAPEIVIVAFDKEVTYEKLERACHLISRNVPYYLTHIDLACPSPRGPIPDCGAIGKLLEATTGVAPRGHFGKPGDELVLYIKNLTDETDKILVAGDRTYTDAALGLALGASTLLVRSGEFNGDAAALDSNIMVTETLAVHLRGI